LTLQEIREITKEMITIGIKAKRASDFMRIPLSTLYYQSNKAQKDKELAYMIKEIAFEHTFYGYRRIHKVINKKIPSINHKKVYRIYKNLQLQRQRPRKNKKNLSISLPLTELRRVNHIWAIDFIFDALSNGKVIKCMPIEDLYSRFVLAIEVSFRIRADKVISVLKECFRVYGIPKILRTDQGAEFRGKIFERFVQQHGIRHEFTAKGSPWQNGDLESFNGKFRDECLSRNLFEDLAETRQMIEKHRIFYNTERPHSGLNRKAPEEVYREGS